MQKNVENVTGTDKEKIYCYLKILFNNKRSCTTSPRDLFLSPPLSLWFKKEN